MRKSKNSNPIEQETIRISRNIVISQITKLERENIAIKLLQSTQLPEALIAQIVNLPLGKIFELKNKNGTNFLSEN